MPMEFAKNQDRINASFIPVVEALRTIDRLSPDIATRDVIGAFLRVMFHVKRSQCA